jgi:hypothetical protein
MAVGNVEAVSIYTVRRQLVARSESIQAGMRAVKALLVP